ncbi:hypothetical protein [Amnibacterium endophyticum]|uniref:DUF4194 domain-containing protein n=1 Tax=Amnibacterium endophyticum TaxID=2109337 RepID=A0ABW4LFY8_9MICO
MVRFRQQLVVDITRMSPAQVEALKHFISTLFVIPTQEDEESVHGWTRTAAASAILDLRANGKTVQEAVLHAETLADDGFVSRDLVYQLGSYNPERQLRGFTRALNNTVKSLKIDGAIADDAADPMAPVYERDGVRSKVALGFEMPIELRAVFAAAYGLLRSGADEDLEDEHDWEQGED